MAKYRGYIIAISAIIIIFGGFTFFENWRYGAIDPAHLTSNVVLSISCSEFTEASSCKDAEKQGLFCDWDQTKKEKCFSSFGTSFISSEKKTEKIPVDIFIFHTDKFKEGPDAKEPLTEENLRFYIEETNKNFKGSLELYLRNVKKVADPFFYHFEIGVQDGLILKSYPPKKDGVTIFVVDGVFEKVLGISRWFRGYALVGNDAMVIPASNIYYSDAGNNIIISHELMHLFGVRGHVVGIISATEINNPCGKRVSWLRYNKNLGEKIPIGARQNVMSELSENKGLIFTDGYEDQFRHLINCWQVGKTKN